MPSWLGKPSSKEIKQKKSRQSLFDAIQRKLKSGSKNAKKNSKSGGVNKISDDSHSEKALYMSVSLSPSLEVSRCHSFDQEPRSQPLPLPSKTADSDAWGNLGTVSVSSNSSLDTNDQPESRLFSPQASDYESGNTTLNSPSRPRDHSPLPARRILKDQGTPANLNASSNDHTLRRRRPFTSHVTNIQIPPRSDVISASDNSIASPSPRPMRTCAQEQVKKSGFSVRRACSDMNSFEYSHYLGHDLGGDISLVWPQNKCSTECSPIVSPRMTRPPLHNRSGESHRLPLPPVLSFSSSFSKNSGCGESSTSYVSRWKKGRLIGSGTFGHVYLGFNSETGEMCAMKEVTLFSDDPKSKECTQQLGQEITLLSRLRHPNIVQYFGSETVDNKLCIYLEYVSGGSIHKLLADYGKLGESAIRSFTRQILSGLAYLHSRKTIHRDIKGANILVDPSGRIKLADFGMAKHISGQSGPLSFKGSPYWMAPEVIRNLNGSNHAVDIWSLGCTVIEMATAKPPWSQYEGVAALFKVGNSKEIPEIPNHLSKEGKDFVCKCLQRNPLDRPTAVQLLEHPFVQDVLPSARYASSENLKKVAGFDLEGMDVKLRRGYKFGSQSSHHCISKHASCPVSPISSPLLKSSQTTFRKKSPPLTCIPLTSSPSCTPFKGRRPTFHSHDEVITPKSLQKSPR